MSIRYAIVGLCAAAAAAAGCGGSDSSSGTNAAKDATFDYGLAAPATAPQSSALRSTFSGTLGATKAGAAGAVALVSFADFSSLTDVLLGSPGVALSLTPGARQALTYGTAAEGDLARTAETFDPSCISVSDRTVTYTNCQFFDLSALGITETLNGKITYSADLRTLSWDLDVKITSTGQVSRDGDFHESGTVTVTETTIKGDLLADRSETQGGTTLAVSEAVLIDLGYQTSPRSCISSGTLEAKRVWTQPPAGLTATKQGAKVTWTGCDVATVALST